jgi:hypothetical protein
MSITSRFKESSLGKFWLKNEKKLVLAIGLILIAALSFEAGFLQGRKNREEPVVVNKTACAPCPKNENSSQTNNTPPSQQNNSASTNIQNPEDLQKCVYVASKNSNKYHLSSCPWAQKIKPENRICFPSAEEAQKRGYQGAKCCIK